MLKCSETRFSCFQKRFPVLLSCRRTVVEFFAKFAKQCFHSLVPYDLWEELLNGYETHVEFADAMKVLDIKPNDMATVFKAFQGAKAS